MSQTVNSDPTQRPARSGTGDRHADTVLLTNSPGSTGTPERFGGTGPSEVPAISDASSSSAFDPDAPRLARLSSRYDILDEAGHGSMGNVYKARDRETGEIVALKLLKPEIASDQGMMERFKNELLFARKITHKNVCRMYDFNRIDGIAYTSMEFVNGESLRSVLNRFGGFPVRKAIGVALQICSGLKEAHAQGIVHRDLKPENVMIDVQGNVKIMDFGIARSMEAATRLTGSMVGTPAYMAPEQVSGKPVDYRTDIYSLGLMLYEMFTGAPAVQADTPVAAALKQIRETPPPPHDVDPSIPVGIERIVLRCLEKDPAKRFQSVAELEKAFSAPGVTGSWPGLPGGPSAVSAPTPVQPARAVAIAPAAAVAPVVGAAQPRRMHPALWTLLGAFIVIVALAGARWARVAKTARLTPPPASLPAPVPPAFALKIPAAQLAKSPSGSAKAVSARRPASNTASAADGVSPTRSTPSKTSSVPANAVVFPAVELPGKKSARQIELEKAPPEVEKRADRAFGEAKASANEHANTYVWVGRYERKERADQAAQNIRKLGLTVAVTQRRGWQGNFWVVVAGPFTTSRAPDVAQWLKAQGFFGAHKFQLPEGMKPPAVKPE
jgi:hypothetical protein